MSKKRPFAYHQPVLQRYIIRDYSFISYPSEYILDEDVVRPWNKRYTTEMDKTTRVGHWLHKSVASHQTYGTCDICFESGPVMCPCRHCKTTGREDQVYQVFSFGPVELDSTTLAHILERELVKQKGDRMFDWDPPTNRAVTVKFLQVAVGYHRILTEEKRENMFNQLYDMLPEDPRL